MSYFQQIFLLFFILFHLTNGKQKMCPCIVNENQSTRYISDVNLESETLKTIITFMYNKNETNIETIFNLLNPNLTDDHVIRAYRYLFDEMKKNDHLFSKTGTIITYRIINELQKRTIITTTTTTTINDDLTYIHNNLPKKLLALFPYNGFVKIENLFNNEKLTTGIHGFMIDKKRRWFATGNCTIDVACNMILNGIDNGKYFNIIASLTDGFVYADNISDNVDRRTVLTFRKNQENLPLEKGKWIFEPIHGTNYYKIKNLYWNEYLIVDDNYRLTEATDYSRIFTKISNESNDGCDFDACKWKITVA